MTYQRANEIFETISESRQREQVAAVMRLAIEYARMRVDYLIAPAEKQAELGSRRSAVHNGLIAAVNELARAMEEAHEDVLWREWMGQDRKEIGDFACFVHCRLGIEAR